MFNVSIITVNLNNDVGLKETIVSVIEQTYKVSEHIIIDGGSTDNSLDVIKEHDSEINYWKSEPDSGIYNAMNKGISLAKGEWIIFMNSGDKFCNNKTLELIFKKNIFKNIDIIYGNTLYKGSNKLLIAPEKINKSLFYSSTLCHQSILTNRKSFKKIGNYNVSYKYVSDREWLLRAKMANLKFEYCNEIVSEWDAEGFCKNNSDEILNEITKMRRTYFNIFEIVAFYFLRKASRIWQLLKGFIK